MVGYVWTCPDSGCGRKIYSIKRGYVRIKAVSHLKKEHDIKGVSMEELDKNVREIFYYECEHSDRMYKSIDRDKEQCICCGTIRNIR